MHTFILFGAADGMVPFTGLQLGAKLALPLEPDTKPEAVTHSKVTESQMGWWNLPDYNWEISLLSLWSMTPSQKP